jgi:hypothetical protein
MQQEVRCWGRADELEELLIRIFKNTKSATLVYGDPGIGKSTVLREVRSRLLGAEKLYVGFWETFASDPDPLLRTLDDLLRHIYTTEGTTDQIRIAFRKLGTSISLTALKVFLLRAGGAALEASGLGPFAKAAVAALGWAREGAEALEARVPSSFLPKMGIDVFRDVLSVLRAALPDTTFVLIIDNLSAPAEAIAAEVRGFGSSDTIQAFLSQDFRTSNQIHLLFSWKLTLATTDAFRALTELLLQYGGEGLELGPIRDKQQIAEWLEMVLLWFQSLSQVEKSEVVGLTGGLPEIVVSWQEAGLSSFNLERLRAAAYEVRSRKYYGLQKALVNITRQEREVLYSLALVPHAIPVSTLAEITEVNEEVCLDTLRRWHDFRLLRWLEPRSGGLPSIFGFEHETKREVARDCLPSTFPDHGLGIQRRAYQVLLRNFTTFPHEENPFAVDYLIDAVELALASKRLSQLKNQLPLLRALKQIIFDGVKPESRFIWAGWEQLPRNIQAFFFSVCLAIGFGEKEQLVQKIAKWVAEKKRRPKSTGSAHALATALTMLTARLSLLEEDRFAWELLRELRKLQKDLPDDPFLAESLASGIVDASGLYMKYKDVARLNELASELQKLCRAFPTNYVIARERVVSLAHSIGGYGSVGQLDAIDPLLDEIRSIHEAFPKETILTDAFSLGLFNAGFVFNDIGNITKAEALLKELQTLYKASERYPPVGIRVAKTLSDTIFAYGKISRTEHIKDLLDKLGSLEQSVPEDVQLAVWYAQGLYNAIEAHRKVGQPTAPLEKEFHDLLKRRPELAEELKVRWPNFRASTNRQF